MFGIWGLYGVLRTLVGTAAIMTVLGLIDQGPSLSLGPTGERRWSATVIQDHAVG